MQNRRKRKRVILALLLNAVAGITGWMIWSCNRPEIVMIELNGPAE